MSAFFSLLIQGFGTIQAKKLWVRTFSAGHGSMKVTVVGAAGKIGQPLCLMLKQSPLIDELCIHDLKPTTGLGLELNHIDTKCKVSAFSGKDNLQLALQHSKIVALMAGAPGADALPYDKMWEPNSIVVKEIMGEVARICPKGLVAIGTNPVNSLVPMACEVLKKSGSYNPNGIFGITALDSVRANTFVAHVQGVEPECVMVPVVGGHSSETIIPVLSQAKPCAEFSNAEIENITASIRNAQGNIAKLKANESGQLASAFAAARFIISLVKALQGYPDIVESAFVNSKVHPFLKYLATPLLLGPLGVTKNFGLPKLSDFEQCMFDNAVPILANDIKKGEKSVGVFDPPPPCDPCAPPRVTPCPHDWCETKN
ncbi:hypothetical protein HUJ04_001882 [Dendroctonus ponderosae]|uniref:Malate dehydrogenase, mitochondrial n=1 Tax=Dendroctonus ponderosae TaxID=77166 RepID=J3JWU1_DENPD|nr:unknown [Dendroctonus ponderosae]KAH1009543.1 hypothetical protein HUJ04_001882 [Dendroctonus ponderosae]